MVDVGTRRPANQDHSFRIGVCSWSLGATTPDDLASALGRVGVRKVQLALDPLRTGHWDEIRTGQVLRTAGVQIVSGMMRMAGEDYSSLESIRRTGGLRPDATWSANVQAARANARIARRLRIPLVTFHAGFIPDQPGPDRRTLIERLRTIADIYDDAGVQVALETGQETAATLMAALKELDRPFVGVNFDPANMVLYGMGNPTDALAQLAHRVLQVHVKDALPPGKPGEWGDEAVAGSGSVDWIRFFDILKREQLSADIVIERESSATRETEIVRARELITEHLSK